MKKVLFLSLHRPDRSPSQRFRYEQYIDFLEANGFACDFSYLLDARDDKGFYRPGNYLGKLGIFVKSHLKRIKDLKKADAYDLVLVQREAFMTGNIRYERGYSQKTKMVFDFDDSIWLPNVSNANRLLAWMKDAGKTAKLIEMSDLIFAGNDYLATYARQFNERVVIIPTTIDTDVYVRKSYPSDDSICIGWTGSKTTIEHFELAIPILRRIKEKYQDKVWFKVIGDGDYVNEELGIKGKSWSSATEVSDLEDLHIGIMPLRMDEWAKGKCGLKGLQYMAMNIPTLMTPVGVNSEIISDGENGYLPVTEDQWVDRLVALIEDADLRKRLGDAGRKTIVDQYSVKANQEKYLQYFRELTQ